MKQSYKNDIVKNYIKRFPNTQSTTIAKYIYAENSAEFKDVEQVRDFVRYIRGLKGQRVRKSLKDKTFVVKPYSLKNPYHLPNSEGKPPKVFNLPRSCNNVLLLSDIHIPYHDIPTLSKAIEYGKKQKINCIFINGDLTDFYQISDFVKLERRRSVKGELAATREFLRVLNKEFPNVPMYLLKGNHDNRLEKYLAVKAPELLDMEEYRLSVHLNGSFKKEVYVKEKYHIEVIDDTTLVKMGKLAVTHGHLLLRGIFAPVNPARGSFLRAKASVIIGHTHKVSTHSETTINGKVITCYSTGCMCELNPAYSPFANNYSHGFAVVKIKSNGHYSVKNIQLINGEIIN